MPDPPTVITQHDNQTQDIESWLDTRTPDEIANAQIADPDIGAIIN